MIMSLKQKKIKFRSRIERFSYEIEMKTREQNRNNQRTEIERFDWLGARSDEKTSCQLSRNHLLPRFLVMLQHDWLVEQCLLHISGKTKRPCFDLFIHWLLKQITNTCRNHFSRSYENRSKIEPQHIYQFIFLDFSMERGVRIVVVTKKKKQ